MKVKVKIKCNRFEVVGVSFIAMGAIGYLIHFALGAMLVHNEPTPICGLLYPRESETREVRSLDGIWNFVKSDVRNPTQGIREEWFAEDLSKIKPTISMPVPASYNDITVHSEIRDHIGTVWYDRKFFVPMAWKADQRVWIRFGSVHYEAYVWINGKLVVKHEIGHLPFEAEISDVINFGNENRITVLCDNALIQTTIPQGKITEAQDDDGITIVQAYSFDFFNYAGIHRSVLLYTTPKVYIEDVTVTTDIVNDIGNVFYKIKINGTNEENNINVNIKIRNKNGDVVADETSERNLKGIIEIKNVKPWWPYLMNENYGYLYNMEIFLKYDEIILDVYRMKIGIRTLKWNESAFLINNEPIYFRGFGKHEDSDIRGKGLDLALIARDFNLIKWIGANSYRTSHYPYSEESMDFADEHGIMIINECPSVDTENFSQALMDKHQSSIQQLIHRDKNRPSVVMWSIANEPRTKQFKADTYFGHIANYTKSLDQTRPITASIAVGHQDDKAGKYLDIISFNRYNSWYSNTGQLKMIKSNVVNEAIAWHEKYKKPVLMSEYGADTLAGQHTLPTFVWDEDYQAEVFSKHFEAFDILRGKGFFIGEFVWNFADFKTAQTVTRVGGNKKGIFTRNRQPKLAAHFLRRRYHALSNELNNTNLPKDLFLYISDKMI